MIGAGVNGRCLARVLAKAVGGQHVVLLDKFDADHRRGSSHGEERITRSSYGDREWVLAMQRAHQDDWPALEADLHCKAIHRGGDAVLFGPESGTLPAYAKAVAEVGADVLELDVASARRRFPDFTFVDCERVLHDRTAGVVAAGTVMRGLHGWLLANGVRLRFGENVVAIEPVQGGVNLRTNRGTVRAERVAVCAGPWIGQLVPELAQVVRPARQHVGYWALEGPVATGRFPAWVRLDQEGTHYGLPCFELGMMKAAFHRTGLPLGDDPCDDDDPDHDVPGSAAVLANVQSRLRRWFTCPIPNITRAESCFYTNSPDDQFVVRFVDSDERVLVVSACSGHAFKLAPHTARQAAALLVD